MEDKFLRQALLLANSPQVMGLEGDPEPAPPSHRFRRRMRRLLANPTGYVRRAARPMWRKVLQTAACLVLVSAVALGGLMMLSPPVRARMSRMVVEQYEDHITFRVESKGIGGQSKEQIWAPAWVPAGYEPTFTNANPGCGDYMYENEQEDLLSLSYVGENGAAAFNLDSEHNDLEMVTINGISSHLLRTNTPDWPSHLVWANEEGTVAFCLTGYLPVEDLIRMAESVAVE